MDQNHMIYSFHFHIVLRDILTENITSLPGFLLVLGGVACLCGGDFSCRSLSRESR